jgi:glycine cleavage system H protein
MASEYFTKDHEWIQLDGDVATIGITNHAQEQLGDVVFVEVPEVGRTVTASEAVAVVESVKAASDVFSPLAGEITEANAALADNPALVNEDPEAGAWFFKVRVADAAAVDGLMDRAAYDAFVASEA